MPNRATSNLDLLPPGFPNHGTTILSRSFAQLPTRAIALFEYYEEGREQQSSNSQELRNRLGGKPKLLEKLYFVADIQNVDFEKREMTLYFQEDGDVWTLPWPAIDYVFHAHSTLPPRWHRLVQERYDVHGGLLHSGEGDN